MNQPPAQQSTLLGVLPIDLIAAVFREQLKLPDLLNCRRVSKRFRDVVDSQLLKELFVFGNLNVSPFYIFRTPNLRNQFKQPDLSLLNTRPFHTFTGLRSLSVHISITNPANLNKFDNLERLYVRKITIGGHFDLFLLNLRTLFIECIECTDQKILMIHSPVVRKLSCERLEEINLVSHDSVRNLTIRSFRNLDLSKFENLQALTLDFKEVQFVAKDVDRLQESISTLNNLKQLRFDSIYSDEISNVHVNRVVQSLLKDRPALKIFLFNIQATEENSATLIYLRSADWRKVFKTQITNYKLLNGWPEAHSASVFYKSLCKIFKKELPNDFFVKFANIRSIFAGQIADPDRFVRFVNSCKDLNCLTLNIANLKRPFFGRLSLSRLAMHSLTLIGQNTEVDYGFIFQLDHLWSCRIGQAPNAETVIALYRACKHLSVLDCGPLNRRFVMFKRDKDTYDLNDFTRHVIASQEWAGLSLQALTDHYRTIFNGHN